jgi:Lipid II flippase MurJ
VGEHNATKAGRLVVIHAAVERKLVATPEDYCETACLNEHGFFGFLADPSHVLIERPSAPHVGDTQSEKADPLLHRPKLPRQERTNSKPGRGAQLRATSVRMVLPKSSTVLWRPRSRWLTGQDAHPSRQMRAFILVIVEAMKGASLRRVGHYGDVEMHSDACSEAGPAFASWTKPTSGGGHSVIPWPQGTPFTGGRDEPSTRGIATVMMAMMFGLVPFGVLYLLQRVFYAFEDARTPFRLQIVVTAVATIANLASLLLPLRWIAVGVGAGQAISNLAGMTVGLVLARRRLEALPLREVGRTYVRLGVASVIAGAAAYLVQLGLGRALEGKLYNPVALVTGGLVFVGICVVAARRLRVHEIDDLVGPVLERVRRTVSRSPRR